MAFGYNIEMDYGRPVNYLQDAMLSGQVQTALQQRFDVNSVKLEEVIKKVSSVPILQEDAKRYLGEKIQGGLNLIQANLKASRGNGLLSNSVSTQLQGYITDAIDEKVKNHIRYSQQIQNFEAGVQKLKEKDPKSYNQKNYEFSKYMAGYNEYLNGTVDSKLGSLQYIPNKDVWGDATKKIDDIIKAKGDMTVDVVDESDPSGKTLIKKSIKGLSKEEIIKYMPNLLDSQDKQQLMIDGWDDMKNLSPQQISASFDEYINTKNALAKEEVDKIDKILAERKGALTNEEIKNYTDKKTAWTNSIEWTNKQAKEVNKTKPEEVGYLLKKESFFNAVSDAFKRQGISQEYKVNPIHEYENKLLKEQRDYELDLTREAREQKKYELDLMKAQADGSITTDPKTGSPALAGASVDSVSEQALGEMKDNDYVKLYDDEYKKMYDETYKGAREVFNKVKSVDPEVEKSVTETMKSYGYIPNKAGNDFVEDPSFKGNRVSKADIYVKSLTEARVHEKHSQLASQISDLVEVNERRADFARTLTKAKQVGKGDAIYKTETKYVSDGILGTRPVTTQIIVSGTPDDYSKMRKVLEESGLRPFVDDKKTITMPPSKGSLLLRIDPTTVSGGTFDPKINYVIKEEGTDLIVTQTKEIKDGDGGLKSVQVSAKIKKTSDVGRIISNEVESEVSMAKELAQDQVPDGYTIRPVKAKTLVKDDNAKLLGNTTNSIKGVIRDKELATNLSAVSLESEAKDLTAMALMRKGYNESEANTYATRIVNNVYNGNLKADVQKNVNEWIVSLEANGKTLNGYARLGETGVLNRDIKKAVQLYNNQYTLRYLIEYLNRGDVNSSGVERIINNLK